jgi:hypothetical protein
MINEPNAKAQVRDIARILGLDADDLAARIALNNANLPEADGYISLSISRETGALNARSESAAPIAEIARMLGIEPNEIVQRMRAEEGK